MLIEINSDNQVTLPPDILVDLRVEAGDHLEIKLTAEGIVLRPHRGHSTESDWLRDDGDANFDPYDLHKFRERKSYYWSLRD